jgi:hypothetical protein
VEADLKLRKEGWMYKVLITYRKDGVEVYYLHAVTWTHRAAEKEVLRLAGEGKDAFPLYAGSPYEHFVRGPVRHLYWKYWRRI